MFLKSIFAQRSRNGDLEARELPLLLLLMPLQRVSKMCIILPTNGRTGRVVRAAEITTAAESAHIRHAVFRLQSRLVINSLTNQNRSILEFSRAKKFVFI